MAHVVRGSGKDSMKESCPPKKSGRSWFAVLASGLIASWLATRISPLAQGQEAAVRPTRRLRLATRRRPVILLAAAFFLGAALFIYWRYYDCVGLGDPVLVDMTKEPPQELWFTPDGNLAYTYSGGIEGQLTLVVYSPSEKVRRNYPLAFSLLPGYSGKLSTNLALPGEQVSSDVTTVREKSKESGAETKREIGEKEKTEKVGEGDRPTIYAISSDAKTVAWVQEQSVYLQEIEYFGQEEPRGEVSVGKDIFSVVLFDGATVVGVLDGERRFSTFVNGKESEESVKLPQGRWRLSSRGPRIIATDRKNFKMGLIVRDEPDSAVGKDRHSVRFFQGSFGTGSGRELVAAESRGTLFGGTENGLIAEPDWMGKDKSVFKTDWLDKSRTLITFLPLSGGDRLNAIANFSEKRLIAAGEFRGIFLISRPRKSNLIGDTLPGVQLLAARDPYVAYATKHEVVLLKSGWSLKTSPQGEFWTTLWAAALSILGLLASIPSTKIGGRRAQSQGR